MSWATIIINLLCFALHVVWECSGRRFFIKCFPTNRASAYQVFLNHRGEDVKSTVASHIYDLLCQHSISVFFDKHEIPAGDFIPQAIREAIESSSVHIVILSRNYAQSAWCLRELDLILKSKATVIPVFYSVRPEEVRWQKGTFAKAFRKHKRRYPPTTVEEWRASLRAVSDISGLLGKEYQGKLAKKVVKEVIEKLNGRSKIRGHQNHFTASYFVS